MTLIVSAGELSGRSSGPVLEGGWHFKTSHRSVSVSFENLGGRLPGEWKVDVRLRSWFVFVRMFMFYHCTAC